MLDEAGNAIPFHVEEYSENISRALVLVFPVRGVPSLGYKTYYLVAAEQPDTLPPAATVKLDTDNDRREPRRPLGSDVLENSFYRLTVEWKTPRFVRIEQLFPLAQSNAAIHYGVPFGAGSPEDLMPNTGPRAGDEIKPDSWRNSRLTHDWIHAGTAEWGLTLATDHQQIRLGQDLIRAQMVRGTRFVSVKVVRGEEIISLHYPSPGTYVFRYSLSSASGDWKAAKAYRTGMNWNNPLLPVSVVDAISSKTLPPTRSFCSVEQGNVVLSALKKADLDTSILLRAYEIEGSPVETPVEFLGQRPAFHEVNLLEEDLDQPPQQVLHSGPYSIKTIKFTPDRNRQ